MIRRRFILLLAMLTVWAVSCDKDSHFSPGDSSRAGDPVNPSPREQAEQAYEKVFIMVSGGHNDLSSYLTQDLKDIEAGYLPEGGTASTSSILVVLSRLPKNRLSNTEVPVLFRMYRRTDGTVVRDTVMRWGEEDRLFSGTVLRDALLRTHSLFPARSYGMVLSSHATGWLPPRYYFNPDKFEAGLKSPRPLSIGQDDDGDVSLEMALPDFLASIPYKLDYLLLDCCLSGCVEVAWGLRGKADLVGFSQTEILADGFDYAHIGNRLLEGASADPLGVCQDYFAQYDRPDGSATISLVDTRQMDGLAELCAALFRKYATQIANLDGGRGSSGYYKVQGYFRYNRHYFYDLEDVLLKAGIDEEEKQLLEAALARCVLYKASTEWFFRGSWYDGKPNGFPINIHSGLSMYLPSMGTEYLNTYYAENMAWNQATHLVQ